MTMILGFDFETTGLDPKVDRVVEVGAVLWDWERKTPLRILSHLITGSVLSRKTTELTGITESDIELSGLPADIVLTSFREMMSHADYMMAHNSDFDVAFLRRECADIGLEAPMPPVIDTMIDLPFDEKIHGSKKLTHLAATHGFLNPFPHRAVFDVLTMLKMASYYDLKTILARNASPTVTVVARVSFDDKDKAKALGFHWEATSKTWEKRYKEIDLKTMDFPFQTVVHGAPEKGMADSGEADAF